MVYNYKNYRFTPFRPSGSGVGNYQLGIHDFVLGTVGDKSFSFHKNDTQVHTDGVSYKTKFRRYLNFLYDRSRYFHELVPEYYELFNDYVNASNIDDTSEGQAILDAINRIGNRRLNARRNILHLAEGFNEKTLWNMIRKTDSEGKIQSSYTMPSFIPLFPPYELITELQSTEKTHEYYTSRINLEASDTGYKRYMKSNHPDLPAKTATERWAFETREASGFKNVIISPFKEDGTTVNPFFVLGSVQDGKDMSTLTSGGSASTWAGDGSGISPTVEHQNLRIPDIEEVMDKAYTHLGDAMGTFLPDPNSHQWINFPARLKVQYFKDRSGTISSFEKTLYKVANPASPDYNTPLVEDAHWWQEKLLRDGSLWSFNGVTETANEEINITRDLTDADYGIINRVGHPTTDSNAMEQSLKRVSAAGIYSVGLADGSMQIKIDESAGTIVITDGTRTITMDGNTVDVT